MGVPGPCGPCSEINYDRGPEFGAEGGPAVNDERYVEIWNLVFMQYERGAGDGKDDFPILGDLPVQEHRHRPRPRTPRHDPAGRAEPVRDRHLDDRHRQGHRAHRRRATAPTTTSDVSLRVVADHMRTSVMLIGDGVTPGNEGRGYVLRRIMRRAIRNMRLLGATETGRRRTRRRGHQAPWASSTRS